MGFKRGCSDVMLETEWGSSADAQMRCSREMSSTGFQEKFQARAPSEALGGVCLCARLRVYACVRYLSMSPHFYY